MRDIFSEAQQAGICRYLEIYLGEGCFIVNKCEMIDDHFDVYFDKEEVHLDYIKYALDSDDDLTSDRLMVNGYWYKATLIDDRYIRVEHVDFP